MAWTPDKDLDTIKCEAVKAALDYHGNNQIHAARALKISRVTLITFIKRCPCLEGFKPLERSTFLNKGGRRAIPHSGRKKTRERDQ